MISVRINNHLIGSASSKEGPVPEESFFRIGQILHARVIQISKEKVVLEDLKGSLIEAKLILPFTNNVFQFMEFIVSDIKNGRVFLKPSKDHLPEKTDKIVSLLNDYNLKATVENIELVKQLIDGGLAASKENILTVQQMKFGYETLLELLSNNNIPKSLASMDIVEVLNILMKSEQQDILRKEGFLNNSIESSKASNEIKSLQSEKHLLLPSTYDIDITKLVFIFKNSLMPNLSNITNINNIVLKDYTMNEQIKYIITVLKNNNDTKEMAAGLEKTLSKFHCMIMQNKLDLESILKELYTKLDLIRQTVENTGSQTREISNQIENVKNGLDFLSKINQYQTFIQIPMNINNENTNLELYILKDNKRRKNYGDNNLKVFLSLNTKNLSIVQVIIDIKNTDINCCFKLASDEAKRYMGRYEDDLRDCIISLGYKEIKLSFTVTDKEINLFDFQKDNSSYKVNTIDLRV